MKSLHAKFYGRYHVLEKLGLVDYRIETPDQRKRERICHVNLLKLYRRRDESQYPKSALSFGIITSSLCEGFDETVPVIDELRHSNQFVPDWSHLSTL